MRNSLISLVVAILMLFSIIATLSACNKKEDNVDDTTNDTAYMAVYQLYVESSENEGLEPKNYEEWLASIRGKDGKDAIAPRLRINTDSNHWEISTDGGLTWQDLGVKATGADGENGQNGKDGVSPHIGENGNWWIGNHDTGVASTGPAGQNGANGQNGINGADGKDGITPQLRIVDGYWELSYDGGKTWTSLGVAVTGPKGDKGDTGDKGDKGDKGDPGEDGIDGVGITEVTIVDGKLIITLSNGNIINLGNVVGKDGVDGAPGQNGNDGVDGAPGQNGNDGIDGKDGVGIANVAIINNNLIVTLSNGNVIDLGNVKGAAGEDGQNGISIVKSVINENGELVLTYSDGSTENLGKVVGSDGKDGIDGTNGNDGKDGITPILRINTDTNMWEVSYDSGKTWESLNVSASGPKGEDGDKGETGNKGDKGDQGEDGVGISKVEYNANGNLVITLTDGSKQTVTMPKPAEHVHTFGNWKKYNSADLSCEDALLYCICNDCGNIVWREGTYEDHDFATVTTTPTCQAGGYDTKTCSSCGKVETTNYTDISSHAYTEGYETDGSYHWKECATCGDVIEKAEHDIDSNEKCIVCDTEVTSSAGLIYEVSADGTYANLVAYEGTATKIIIAEEYMGVPVKVIGKRVFVHNKAITSVMIPDSVTTVEESAFYGCNSLTDVNMPQSLETLANFAFSYCGFSTLVLPESVTTIGENAFGDCANLSNITITNHAALVGEGAFSDCHPSIYTDEGYCKYAGSVDNPYEILIEVSNMNFANYPINESCKIIVKGVFDQCKNITSIIIPDSVVSIGEYAFNACTSTTYVVIGSGVKTVGRGAFYVCSNITAVYYKGTASDWDKITINSRDGDGIYLTRPARYYYSDSHPTTISNLWHMKDGVPTMWCYTPVVDSAVAATCTSSGLTQGLHCGECNTVLVEQLPVDPIGHDYVNRVCANCGDILYSQGLVFESNGDGTCKLIGLGECPDSYLFIPPVSPDGDAVTAIGEMAFHYCDQLRSVTIPGSVNIIESYAFSSCENIEQVYLGEGVMEIHFAAFFGCVSLVKFTLPTSITYLGNYIFARCISLCEINYSGSAEDFYWNVSKEDMWNQEIGICILHCTDNNLEISNENEAA